MKILCYGSNGWIGAQMKTLLEQRGHVVIQGVQRLDDFNNLCAEIDATKPDYVFSSIGRTHGTHSDGRVFTTIDYLELPGNLVCGYMGTGCIFEYDETHAPPSIETKDNPIDCSGLLGFTEEDIPNFKGSGYSIVKGWTDQQMHLFRGTVCNWRIRMPISAQDNSRDFITKICNYGRVAKVCSVANSMTVLSEMLPIMIHMIEQRITGTWNMCNPGLITHNQILEMYKQLIDPHFSYQNFSVEEQAKILKAGRSNNFLDTSLLENYCSEYNLQLTNIYEAVQKTLQNRK